MIHIMSYIFNIIYNNYSIKINIHMLNSKESGSFYEKHRYC